MKWEVKVTNVNTRLRVRTGPGTSYRIVNWQYPSGGIVVESKKNTNGQLGIDGKVLIIGLVV